MKNSNLKCVYNKKVYDLNGSSNKQQSEIIKIIRKKAKMIGIYLPETPWDHKNEIRRSSLVMNEYRRSSYKKVIHIEGKDNLRGYDSYLIMPIIHKNKSPITMDEVGKNLDLTKGINQNKLVKDLVKFNSKSKIERAIVETITSIIS